MKDRIIAVLLVIGIITCVYFALQNRDYGPEQADLTQQINDTREAIDALAVPSLDLQREYDAAQAALAAERLALPLAPDTSDVIDALIRAGKTHGVTVVPLNTGPWDDAAIDDYRFLTFDLHTSLSGELNPILDLIEEIEAGAYPGLVLIGLGVDTDLNDPSQHIATAVFRIYARPGN